MTTVDDFGEYTGAHGFLKVDNVTWADVEFDVKWSRSTVTHSRASKFSDIQIPGKLTVKATIKKVLVHSEAEQALGYSLTDASTSGSATACLAATSFTAGTAVPITSDPATPSVVKVTTSNATGTLGGSFTIVGTNANDDPISESFEVPALCPQGTEWQSTKVFKTANYAITDGVTGTLKFQIDGVAAMSSYVVHNPKIFDIEGGVLKSGKSITITMPTCWFSEGGLAFVDAGTILEVNTAVEMHDPDLLEVTVVG
jgi:hypothetical protein